MEARRAARWLATAAVAVALSACAVGPDYRKPTMDLPLAFKEGANWQRAEANPQASL
ncbi:hypothetical protein [Burkholderia gladioli]|nr:hypothetical protein [Burkholderia gladioli]